MVVAAQFFAEGVVFWKIISGDEENFEKFDSKLVNCMDSGGKIYVFELIFISNWKTSFLGLEMG